MARWRLTQPHYLNLADSTKWEYTETDRITGRPKRTQFNVPQFLDPNSDDDIRAFGQPDPDGVPSIIVSDGNDDPKPKDVVFLGDPTPDMYPIDDAAKALSAKFNSIWSMQPGSDEASFASRLQDKLLMQIGEVAA